MNSQCSVVKWRETDFDPPDLESILGDPADNENPFGYRQILQADEQGTLNPAAEALLDQWGFNAEFVPVSLGGRLSGVDSLIARLRPVFRRDAAVGLGYGVTSLMAAVNVWASGSITQREVLARLLLMGEKISVGYHELAHGNDFLRNTCSATTLPDGRLGIHGVKQVINNAHRAAAWVVFARTGEQVSARSHSLLLLDRAGHESDIASGRLRILDRYRTVGVRGCHLTGLEFSGCMVGPDSLIGEPGSAVETALRSFQVTRVVMPGLAVGMLDTALRVVYQFARERRLYGTRVLELPHARAVMNDAYVDLLIADCLVTVAARSLHMAPAYGSVYAAATKYLVPGLLRQAMDQLSVVLGARAYLRDGPFGIFSKMARDLPGLSLGHAGGLACLMNILAQLPALARRAGTGAVSQPEMFASGTPLPELKFDMLTISAHGDDTLLAMLSEALAARERGACMPEGVALHLKEMCRQRDDLYVAARALKPQDIGPAAGASSFDLARRYALLAAAAACVGCWMAHRDQEGPLDDKWIVIALARLSQGLRKPRGPFETLAGDSLIDLLGKHVDARRSLCLHNAHLYGDLNA